jgi:hypothetical protein
MSKNNLIENLKLYRGTNLPRKIKIQCFGKKALLERRRFFRDEMVRRGYIFQKIESGYVFDFSAYQKTRNKIIIWNKEKRDYSFKNLSLLSLIELSVSEIFSVKLDLIKIETYYLLFNMYKIFKFKEFISFCHKRGFDPFDFYKGPVSFFLDYLYLYLFDIAKMLVSNLGHDLGIKKDFCEDISLYPMKKYDEKFIYFSEIPFYFPFYF